MNLEKFKKLQNIFANRRFETAYNWTEKTLYIGSIFGNILCVIFAFFFVNDIVKNAAVHFGGQQIILPIFIILFLSLFELTKRFVFANIVTGYLITKKITNTIIVNVVFALLLITGSFYLSLSGANTYSNKTDIITQNTDSLIQSKVKILDSTYSADIIKVEERINYVYHTAKSRRKQALTVDEMDNVKVWEQDIKNLRFEKDNKIRATKSEALKSVESKLNKTSKGNLAFLFISAFLELLILIGVVFSKYYYYTTYIETKDNLESNPNYIKLQENLALLSVLYNNGKIKTNQQLPTISKFRELAKTVKFKTFKITELNEFLALVSYLSITKIDGKKRLSAVDFSTAKEILTNHFPVFE